MLNRIKSPSPDFMEAGCHERMRENGSRGFFMRRESISRHFPDKNPKAKGARQGMWFLLVGIFIISTCFLFFNLGTYSLWDDEAETALGARGILLTGDTTAVLDHNIQARRAGINLVNLHDRLTPPLASYLTAFSFHLGHETAWFARLPFALCGLFAIALMLFYLWKEKIPFGFVIIFGMAVVFQVSFFLYFRQCRYYGSSMFLAVAIFYLYLVHWRVASTRVGIGLLSALLFFSHPLICVQVGGVLLLDWCVFRRRDDPFQSRWLLEVGGPFIGIVVPSLFVWNPFLTKSSSYLENVSWLDRMTLFWWNIRDLLAAEFLPASILLLAPMAYFLSKDRWILRAVMALFVILAVTSLLSYQRVQVTQVADVRYLIAAMPIGLALTAITLGRLFGKLRWGWVGCLLILGSNIGSGKILWEGKPASMALAWWGELLNPIEEPYAPVAAWITQNVSPRASIWVEPDYMMYPLMFHAPEPIYAWQLDDPQEAQWAGLPPIHFKGQEKPEYVVVFGPAINNVMQVFWQLDDKNLAYKQVAQINYFWKDLYRPELFWRTFHSVRPTGGNDAIYIFKRS